MNTEEKEKYRDITWSVDFRIYVDGYEVHFSELSESEQERLGKERSMCTSCTRTDHLVFQAGIILRPALKGTEHLNLMRTFCFRQ